MPGGNWALIPAVEALRIFTAVDKHFRREASGGQSAEPIFGELVLNHTTVRYYDKLRSMLVGQLNNSFARVAEMAHNTVVDLSLKTRQELRFDQHGQLCDQVTWVRAGEVLAALDSIRNLLDSTVNGAANWLKFSTGAQLTDEQRLGAEQALRAVAMMVRSTLGSARHRVDALAGNTEPSIIHIFIRG